MKHYYRKRCTIIPKLLQHFYRKLWTIQPKFACNRIRYRRSCIFTSSNYDWLFLMDWKWRFSLDTFWQFSPIPNTVFSGIAKNHVGIILKVDGNNITIQDGNYDGITNTFEDAKKDWQTNTYTLDYYRSRMGGIVFANPK